MKTDIEIRKKAKRDFDRFSLDDSALSWTAWNRAYYLAYKDGATDALTYATDKLDGKYPNQ